MSETLDRPPTGTLSTLPGATVIRGIRGMLLSAMGTALVYSFIGNASKGGCAGGGSIETNGGPGDVAPTCVNVTLSPSPIVFIAIAVTIIVAISLVLRSGRTEASALRIIDRAVIVIIAGTLAWTVLTMVSFFAIPLDPPAPGESFMIPFTFGVVDVEVVR